MLGHKDNEFNDLNGEEKDLHNSNNSDVKSIRSDNVLIHRNESKNNVDTRFKI